MAADNTKRVIDYIRKNQRQVESRTPIATDMFIPNHDGRIERFKGFGNTKVTFANGSTYYVDENGDAVFKDITGQDLTITKNSNVNVNIYTDTNNDAGLFLGEASDVGAKFVYDGGSNDLILYTLSPASVTALKVARTTGNVTFVNQVNFANGVTYRVESDGDATFKKIVSAGAEINNTHVEMKDSQINRISSDSDDAMLLLNYEGYLSGTTKYRDIGFYDGKQNLLAYFDGSQAALRFGATEVRFANGSTYKIESDGDAVFKSVKNPVDNAGFYTGAGDDCRWYHDGTNTWLLNSTGTLRLKNTGGSIILNAQDGTGGFIWLKTKTGEDVTNDIGGKFTVRDIDDSNVTLLELDSDARTLKIGSAADSVDIYTDDVQGVSGTFEDLDSNTITVTNGLITDLGV